MCFVNGKNTLTSRDIPYIDFSVAETDKMTLDKISKRNTHKPNFLACEQQPFRLIFTSFKNNTHTHDTSTDKRDKCQKVKLDYSGIDFRLRPRTRMAQ